MPGWDTVSAPHRRLHTGSRGEDVQRFQKALEARSGVPVPNDGVIGSETLRVKRRVFWDLGLPDRDYPITIAAQGFVRWPWTRTLAARRRARERALVIDLSKGAKATVEKAVEIALREHPELYVVSDYRPGDPMDHGGNSYSKAARDIAYPGRDALTGPPHPFIDDAVVAIGKALGRDWRAGETVIDTWYVDGWRLQAIWRTPRFGGHDGHLHLGMHRQ